MAARADAGPKAPFKSADSVLRARSVAVVGASERARWPAQLITNLQRFKYPGTIGLVNPNRTELFGQRCYPRLADLPEPPEHAMIIVPAPAVPAALEDAAAAGVTSATIYASQLGDGDDPESHERGAWLRQFVARSKLRISGPNCMGAMSYRERLFAYPNAELGLVAPGPVGIAFQSGGILMYFMQTGATRGLRFSYAISSGNEVDLDLADYLSFLVDDAETRVIVLFIEGIRRPDAFMLAAGRALAAGKPVLAIKTGASAGSAEAAQSHTGAIAGDYAAFLAMCDRYGIVVCRSLDDLVQQTLAFQYSLGRRPKGPRLAFVTNSGGAVDLLFDHCESEHAALAQFSPHTKATLLPLMQPGITPKNPLDVGLPASNDTAAKWCAAVLADADVDMLAFAAQPRTAMEFGDLAPYKRAFEASDKPILGISRFVYQIEPDVIALQDTLGVPIIHGLDATVRAMNALWFHAERQGRVPPSPASAKSSALGVGGLEATLASYGISCAASRNVQTAEDAAAAAQAIGFPVALKIQSSAILHKTEAGGVALGLASPKAVLEAARELADRAHARVPDAVIDGYLVQQMVTGVEVIVGARTDPLYGPMLLVGAGGILVELARDVSLALLPLSPAEIGRMLDPLAVSRLLAGYRGSPPADRAALETTIAGLARFYLDHREKIRDIEINPLMVQPAGQGVVAVDVRVIWNEIVNYPS